MKTNWRGSIGAETDVSDARLEGVHLGMKLMTARKHDAKHHAEHAKSPNGEQNIRDAVSPRLHHTWERSDTSQETLKERRK